MDSKAIDHFEKHDPVLFEVAKKFGGLKPYQVRKSEDYFSDLCKAIVGQQLSGRAAETIWKRIILLFPENKITLEGVLKVKGHRLRKAGLSWAKIKYVKDLAEKVRDKLVQLNKLDQFSDQEIIFELTKVNGIGPWTAEMFLMFTLGRPDVFSYGDLGLHKAICKIYNLQSPSREQIENITLCWSPYRSFACRVLWQSLDNR